MKSLALSTFVLAATLAFSPVAAAGPWIPSLGHGYAKLGGRALISSRYIDGQRVTSTHPGYRELTVPAYFELGLGRGFAAIVHGDLFRFISISHTGGRAAESTIKTSDPELGLAYQLFTNEGWAAAAELGVRLPITSSDVWATIENDAGTALAEVRFGSGQLDVRAGAHIGYATRDFDLAISASYLARTGGYDHALRWSAEVGGNYSLLFGRLRLGGQHRLDTGDAPLQESLSGIGNGTSYTSMIFELGVHAGGGLQLGLCSELSLFGLGLERQARGAVISMFGAWSF